MKTKKIIDLVFALSQILKSPLIYYGDENSLKKVNGIRKRRILFSNNKFLLFSNIWIFDDTKGFERILKFSHCNVFYDRKNIFFRKELFKEYHFSIYKYIESGNRFVSESNHFLNAKRIATSQEIKFALSQEKISLHDFILQEKNK